MTIRAARSGEVNYHTVDRFTLAHVAIGSFLGLVRAPLWLAVSSAIAWELVENCTIIRSMTPYPTYDTPHNAVVDVAAWIMGWGLAYRLGDSYPLIAARPKTN